MAFLAAGMLTSTHSSGQSWQPERHVEIIVGTSAGGGLDSSARFIQRLWQERKLIAATFSVVNKPGGGGSVGLAYIVRQAGDGHFLMIVSNPLVTSHITGSSPLTYTDVSPIALLFNEYVGFAVAGNSDVKDGRDFLDRLRTSPGAISVSMPGAPGSVNHVALGVAVKEAGGDARKLKLVVFPSSSEAKTALLGGHVNAMVAPISNLLPQMLSGNVRVLAVSSPARLAGPLSTVPTWREQGVDSVVASWRGMVGAKGLSAGQVAYWEIALNAAVQMKEWKEFLEKNAQAADFRRSTAFRSHLAQEYRQLSELLSELGLVKTPK